MSVQPHDNTDGSNQDAGDIRDARRYAELDVDDGTVIVYDQKNHRAWIQSSTSEPLTDLR
jgi:hypothetical protein